MRDQVLRLVRDATYRLALATPYPAYRRRRGAAIFAFHNVIADDGMPERCDRSLHVPVGEFTEYLDVIESAHMVVPLIEIGARLRRQQSVEGLAALTFDDAYRGVIRHAVPLLAQRGLPATLFVVSGAAAAPSPFWWDLLGSGDGVPAALRDRALNALQGDRDLVLAQLATAPPTMPTDLLSAGWGEVREAARAGLSIGSHTASHRNLAAIGADAVVAELERSHAEIGAALGTPPGELSYPYGSYDDAIVAIARRAGYTTAVTMRFGLTRLDMDPLALPRINVPSGISIPALACWGAGIRLRGAS